MVKNRAAQAPRCQPDHARSRHALKRGGEFEITSLETEGVENPAAANELSSISDALDQLAKIEPDLRPKV
jgi:hypothetical protein